MKRRVFLQLTALAPALAILEQPTGVVGATRSVGRRTGHRLEPQSLALLGSVIDRLAATGEPGTPMPTKVGVLDAVDEILGRLDPSVAEALAGALTWIDWWPVFGELRFARFSSLDAVAQRESLESWRSSGLEARRRIYRALRGLSLLAYWSRPEAWPQIGYPGPSVPSGVGARAGRHLPDPRRTRGDSPTGETLEADVCVIGAGAGGSVVAALLAEAGRRVVLLEAGPSHQDAPFDQREDSMLPELYEEAGSRASANGEITILQGRGLGGSTVPGLGYCFRTPQHVLADWRHTHGVVDLDSLGASFRRVEAGLAVGPVVPNQVNPLNAALRRGSSLLGYHGLLTQHNRVGCRRSGTCLLGCRFGALRSMRVSYLPRARRAGARILSGATAETVGGEPGRRRVEARLVSGRPLRVEAPQVVCAAGAIATPLLLAASGLGGASGELGLHLRLQPSVVSLGIFPEPVMAWQGMPAAWYIDEFLGSTGAPDGGYALTPFSAFPAMTAVGLPGSGAGLFASLRDYPRMGGLRAVLRDRSEGQVAPAEGDSPEIRYELEARDRRLRVSALKRSVELLWASGAREVLVPLRGGALRLAPSDGVTSIDRHAGAAGALPMLSTEPMGSCRMGGDPSLSVVDSYGELHDAPGIFVADASTLPSPPGAPPLITIAALADRAAQRILSRRAPRRE